MFELQILRLSRILCAMTTSNGMTRRPPPIWRGMAFRSTPRAESDPFAFEKLNDRMRYREDRFATTALVDGGLLSVSWTLRDGTIRIISARFATAQERRLYHDEGF